jgi:type I restriction enzyme S subunit
MSVPALRFKEFSGDWEFKRLGEVGEIVTGNTPDTKNHNFYDGDKLFVSPVDINTNRFIGETRTTLTDKGFKEGRKVKAGSILFVCIGSTIGKVAQNKTECITNQQINAVVPNDYYSSNFIYSLLEKHALKIALLAGKQAVPIINKTTFSKVEISTPSIPEQTKIANFLTSVDEKISILTQKASLLSQYKKGVMQQIFSQELRFKDDDGQEFPEWDVIELETIATKVTKKNKGLDINEVLTNSATQGIVSQSDYFDREIANQKNLSGYYVVEVNDFVYNPRISSHALVGPIKRNNLKVGVMSPLYTVFRFKEGNLVFFEQYFQTTQWHDYMKSVSNSGARHDRMNITNESFIGMPLPYPTIKEQTKIANFLTAIDYKITNNQTQLDALKQYKQGLLQQMFV